MKPAKRCRMLTVLLTSTALLTACASGPRVETTNVVCPDRRAFTPEQADRIADRIEDLAPDDPLIPYVIEAESVHAQLDEVCP